MHKNQNRRDCVLETMVCVVIPVTPEASRESLGGGTGKPSLRFDFGALFCRSNLLYAIIDAAPRTAGLLVTFLFGRAKRKVTTS